MSIKVNINSEIGDLEAVIIHSPGPEVENMTPENAERALYSDILNLAVVSEEYNHFNHLLSKVTNTYQIKDLLEETVSQEEAREYLVSRICLNEHIECLRDYLFSLASKKLATQLIEGVPGEKDTLTKFLNNERYALQPLHNFFFTRDSSFCINQNIIISKMSNQVREREALIMEAIFKFHPLMQNTSVITTSDLPEYSKVFFEGGDFIVVRDDIVVVGIGARTSSQGVDFIIDQMKSKSEQKHIIVQELPLIPESFIHLDMVFTMIDHDLFMIYEPVILNQHDYQTVHISLDNGRVQSICEEKNIPHALQNLGINPDLALCGGNSDDWIQEREQWHSGANFFALGPGKVIGYGRNINTINELDSKGLSILPAKDILSGNVNLQEYEKYVITMEGTELARGGGGAGV